MNKFLDLLESSVIVSGAIAMMLIGTMCYLALTQQAMPEILANATMVVVGFFFGKGSAVTLTKALRK